MVMTIRKGICVAPPIQQQGRNRKEEEGKGRQRKAEEGRGRQRKAEEGRGRQRKGEEGRGRLKKEVGRGKKLELVESSEQKEFPIK
ncbi:unnamed protein product [Phyllotreta striolata]|uniref:Uncharacterized protein n=1 Tax=Phyllotreta striolata TaxID=444603 RepID=A0A9N9XI17_PHYSR|nr:unnamed protein product [Phyllotreta striolata]